MTELNSRVRIVLGNGSVGRYPQAGGLWTWFLQFVLGLVELGHDVVWLELVPSTGDSAQDRRLVDGFFARADRYGIRDRCVLLLYPPGVGSQALSGATAHGMEPAQLERVCRTADVCWNFAAAMREPLLSMFGRRAFLDGDPGHLQVSATQWDLGLADHDAFLTVGAKVNDEDCRVPTLGFHWQPFLPFVHLPLWERAPTAGPKSPFTTVTQWTWEELWWEDSVLSVSKRDAYLRYAALPSRVDSPFELAANIHPEDHTGDRELLARFGWRLRDPHVVAGTPDRYAAYIRGSRAELSCPKPIHRVLKTGWFSDRSAAYMASGRPVLAEDTGFSDHLPVGQGLLTFATMEEAVAGVDAIQSDYARHASAARDLAADILDARKVLPGMVEATTNPARRSPPPGPAATVGSPGPGG